MPSPNYYGPSPLVNGVKSEPYSLLTAASLPPGTMALLPGCLIASTADVTWTPTIRLEGVGVLPTPRLTFWHLPPEVQEALEVALFTALMDRV